MPGSKGIKHCRFARVRWCLQEGTDVGGLVRCPWTMTSELARLQMGLGQMSPGILFQPHHRPSWDRFHGVFSRAERSNDALLTSLREHLNARRRKLPSLNWASPQVLIQSIKVSRWAGLGHRLARRMEKNNSAGLQKIKSHEVRSLRPCFCRVTEVRGNRKPPPKLGRR